MYQIPFPLKRLSPSRRTKQPFSICKYLSLQLFTDPLQRQLTTQKASKMFWNRTTQIRKEHTYLFLHASTRSPAMIERSLSIMKDFYPSFRKPSPLAYFFIFFYLLFKDTLKEKWFQCGWSVPLPVNRRPGVKVVKTGGFLLVASLMKFKGIDCT